MTGAHNPDDDPARAERRDAARPALRAGADAEPPIALRVAVWPRCEGHGWRAELRIAGQTRPLHFDKPLDLVLFLTALPGSPSAPPHGLR